MVYCSALLPILYFKSGIIDPWFNLFIFYGTYATWKAIYNSDGKHLLWSLIAGASIGLGIMTKGPVALLVILMVFGVFYLWKRFKVPANFSHFFGLTISLFVVGGLWFFIEYISGRGYIIEDFIEYQIRLMQRKMQSRRTFLLSFHCAFNRLFSDVNFCAWWLYNSTR